MMTNCVIALFLCGLAIHTAAKACDDVWSTHICSEVVDNGDCSSKYGLPCKKTCNKCDLECKDIETSGYCKWVTDDNLCGDSLNKGECMKTCGLCEDKNDDEKGGLANHTAAQACADVWPTHICSEVVDNSDCSSKYSLPCKKTCNKCDLECKDIKTSKHCKAVQDHDECGDSRLKRDCMKTCGLCECRDIETSSYCKWVKDENDCGDSLNKGKCMKTCGLCE